MVSRNPFADDEKPFRSRENPFGDEPDPDTVDDSLMRIEHAGRKIRSLRAQLGAEGLSIPAQREMMDQLGRALDSTARVLRELTERHR
jgi:hypothetical protein